MGGEPPGELPDPLDGCELRAVGRQEEKLEVRPVPAQVRLEELGVVVPRVVQDDDHFHAPRPPSKQALEEAKESFRVEHRREGVHELPRAEADGAEAGDRLPGRRVEDDRVLVLRRHPDMAAGAVPLEVALVLAPELDVIARRQLAEFF